MANYCQFLFVSAQPHRSNHTHRHTHTRARY